MKVLFYSPYITIDEMSPFSRSKTGFGYMVRDIATAMTDLCDVDLLTLSGLTSGLVYKKVNILPNTLLKFLLHFRLSSFVTFFSLLFKYRFDFKEAKHFFIACCTQGYIRYILNSKHYDLVHIHSSMFNVEVCIRECKRKRIPYLITSHASALHEQLANLKKDNSVDLLYEIQTLTDSMKSQINWSFVSSGLKKVFIDYIPNINVNLLHSIPNGCDITQMTKSKDVRSILGIPKDAFVYICVGNICVRKNQIEIAKAYHLIPDLMIKDNIYVLFLGSYQSDSSLLSFIKKNGYSSHLIMCGAVPKSDIHNYYQAANASIMVSISEAFGLGIIEGYIYGLPALTFNDITAKYDLYNVNTMFCVKDRDTNALASAMIKFPNMTWSESIIKEFAKNFSFQIMALKYNSLYKKIINE